MASISECQLPPLIKMKYTNNKMNFQSFYIYYYFFIFSFVYLLAA